MRHPYLASTLLIPALFGSTHSAVASNHTSDLAVIYSEIQTHPSSSVSGIPGLSIRSIDRPFLSPDGSFWMMTVELNTGSSVNDEVLIRNGIVMAREDTTAPYLPPLRKHGFFDVGLAVLDTGAFVFSGDLNGNLNNDDVIFVGDPGGNISILAREGSQIPGGPAGWTARAVDSPLMTNAGPGYQVDNVTGGPPVGQDELIMLNGSVFLQVGIDVPSGQFTGNAQPWEQFELENVFMSSDGSHHLVQGILANDPSTGKVVVVDGAVVLQQDFAIPGADPADVIDSGGIRRSYMAESGNWVAHGDFDGSEDGYVVHNGLVVAREGLPIHGGATETFNAHFTFSTCNSVGDYVIAGLTDGAATSNAVVVLNNSSVLCREGDPIDLDGNGAFDDDVFISGFNTDEAALSDDVSLHFVASLKNGGGSSLGDAYFVLNVGGTSGVSIFCNPADNNSTGLPTLLAGTLGNGVESGLHLEATQGPPTQFGYFLIGTGVSEPGLPISQGHLCLAVSSGNAFGRYNVSGGALNSIGQFDGAGVFQNAVGTSTVGTGFDVPNGIPILGFAPISAGQTWHFQCWYREAGGNSNFSNGVSVAF